MDVDNAETFWKTGVEAPTVIAGVSNQFGKKIWSDYERHRHWLLHELRQCRAQARGGAMTKTARKSLQKELGKLRRAR